MSANFRKHYLKPCPITKFGIIAHVLPLIAHVLASLSQGWVLSWQGGFVAQEICWVSFMGLMLGGWLPLSELVGCYVALILFEP